MPRDFIGYSCSLPKVVWPQNARLALSFVLNYEEGSESNVLDGEEHSEHYLTDLPGVKALNGQRHLSVESLFEYGSRAGIWRLLRLFDEHNIPLTLFATGLALERNPPLAEALKHSPHELPAMAIAGSIIEMLVNLSKENIFKKQLRSFKLQLKKK